MSGKVYVYEQIEEIVYDAGRRCGITPHFQFGHPMEILENLRAMTADPKQQDLKYPLFALFADFTEVRGEIPGIDCRVNLHMIIATLTEAQFSTKDRVTVNFQPILYPLYVAFMTSLGKSGYYMLKPSLLIPHKKTDRLFWGKNGLYLATGNVFEDLVDCIEIEDLELSVITQKSCIS